MERPHVDQTGHAGHHLGSDPHIAVYVELEAHRLQAVRHISEVAIPTLARPHDVHVAQRWMVRLEPFIVRARLHDAEEALQGKMHREVVGWSAP